MLPDRCLYLPCPLNRCTSLYGVPTMFIDMLNHPEFMTFDLSSLSTGIMAGSPCPVETMKQVVEKMHMDQVTVNIFLSFLIQAEQFYSF